ncbi:transposase [Rhizobiales bacterium GAS191]|nr:transposase [Rhizobiales bacterium GAS191]SED20520.1 transposase [Rhizobiales bacterium GAS191]SED23524.1 transposase [Rhizobiales bacterium GAS191]SED49622.1 transposase [Rhizobiales bacterium GAS191]SED84893.1 transposase [Rhizobiales bacterium GAS191]
MLQEVLTGVERRRRWSVEEKLSIVAEACAEGINLSDVARRHDITRQHIYQWRRELRDKGLLSDARCVFVPVDVAGDEAHRDIIGAGPGTERAHRVEIGLRNGRSVRVAADVPEAILHRIIRIAEAT